MTLTPPPRSLLAGWAAIAVLAAVVAAMTLAMRPPAPVGTDAPAGEFSADRAMDQLRRIAAAPHPVGTAEHDRVRGFLTDQMRALGLDVRQIDGTSANPRLKSPFPVGRVSTIVATLRGQGGGGRIYLDAHYDSVRTGAGENDDSVAVAALVEVARALTTGPRPRNDVVFVFSDGEEPGMLGVRHLLDTERPSPDAAVVLNFEARGVRGPAVMFETAAGNAGVIDHFGRAPTPLGFSLSYEVYKRLPNDTNFSEWRDAGFTGLNFAYLDGSAYYDSSGDAIEHVNRAGLQHDGVLALSLARSLGAADLSRLDTTSDTYFWVPGVLLAYPNWLALPLALLALALLIAVVVLAARRGLLRLKQYGYASLSLLAPLVAVPLLAMVFWLLAKAVRPEYGTFVLGDPYGPAWYRAGLITMAFVGTAAWYLALRRRLGGLALALAGCGWLAVLAVVVTLAAPGAGYLFALPALVWSAGALALVSTGRLASLWPVAVLAGALAAAVVGVPIVALLLPALGVAFGAVPVLLVVLLAAPAMPLLNLAVPRWAVPVTGAASLAAVGLLVTGLLTDPIDAAHPRPTSLVYALDADTGQARWLSADPVPNRWTRGYVGTKRQEMAADFPPLTGFFISSYLTGPAPAAALPAPDLSIVDTSSQGGGRTVRLHVRSVRGAPVLWLHVSSRAPAITSATVDGLPVPGDVPNAVPGGEWGWGFGFHALPPEGIDVTLTFAAADPVDLRVVDQADGLAGLPGYRPMPADMETSVLPADASYVAHTVRV